MTFDELLKLVRSPSPPALCADSRLVTPGCIFVAVTGTNFDGHDFIGQALGNGARYIVCRQDKPCPESHATVHGVIPVYDTYLALAILAFEHGFEFLHALGQRGLLMVAVSHLRSSKRFSLAPVEL